MTQAPPPADPALLARLASRMAHEMRNPLSAVKIALQSLERRGSDERDAARLRIALREVDNLERMLADVVEWARPPSLHKAPVDAAELVQDALGGAREALEGRAVRVAAAPVRLQADRARAARALAELVKNAARAAPPGGVVRVLVEQGDSAVAFHVDDPGPGPAPADAVLAFEPFFSRHAGALGLGLALARQIALAHGGDVTLAPAPGGGTRATLRLPGSPP